MDNGLEMKKKEKEFSNIIITIFMRDFGKVDADMERELIIISMEIGM